MPRRNTGYNIGRSPCSVPMLSHGSSQKTVRVMLLVHKLTRLMNNGPRVTVSYHHMNTSWACPEALCTYRKTYGPFLQAFEADALVIKEPPLVGAQHAANKADALVCSRCFTMIGSLEQQMAHRLLSMESPGQLHMCLCT